MSAPVTELGSRRTAGTVVLPEDTPVAPGNPFVNIHFILSAIRRRRRLWIVTALMGVTIAIGTSFALPPAFSATTTLRLSHTPGSDPARAVATDSRLLHTRIVAQAALAQLGLDMTPERFLKGYRSEVLSDEVLTITATGGTAREATRRGDAIAAAFLNFRAAEFRHAAVVVVQALQDRQATLEKELTSLNTSLDGFSAGSAGSASLGDLITRRSDVRSEIAQLQLRIQGAAGDATSVVETSRVLDQAEPMPRSRIIPAVANAASGLVGGLALGLGWVTILAVASDRLRRREDVAAALCAPVMSVGRIRQPRWLVGRRLRHRVAHPAPGVRAIARHLKETLSALPDPVPALAVIPVGCTTPSVLALAVLANQLTGEGSRVLVVDLTTDPNLTALLSETFQETVTSQAVDIVLVLSCLDPALGAEHLRELALNAVVVVEAGRSTATRLASTSEMLRLAGLNLASAVLVGADATDESLGTAPS